MSTERPVGPRRISDSAVLILAAVFVTAAALALAGWFRADTETRESTAAPSGATASDQSDATGELIDDVDAAMVQLWSYDYRSLDGVQSLSPVVTSAFLDEYAPVYERIEKLAPATKAVVEAEVAESAVVSVEGDKALVLVYLNQNATKGADAAVGAGARLRVELQRVEGTWLVNGVTPF